MHLALDHFWLARENTTLLYPHVNEVSVMLVPKEVRSSDNVKRSKNELYLSVLYIWWTVAIPISIMRWLIERMSYTRRFIRRTIAHIYTHSLSTLIGNSMPSRDTTRVDRMLVLTLAMAAILLDMHMSTHLFCIFTQQHVLNWRFKISGYPGERPWSVCYTLDDRVRTGDDETGTVGSRNGI